MKSRRFVGIALALALAGTTAPMALLAQQSTSIAGTAKDEAKKPYTDFTVRARDVRAGSVAATIPLDTQGNFALAGLSTENYLVELLNKDGKVVCTEGPFDLSKQAIRSDVIIDCGNVPAAWWRPAQPAPRGKRSQHSLRHARHACHPAAARAVVVDAGSGIPGAGAP